ncbi:TPA: hypothetical protein EYP26_01200 [Candidatus Bathyarchaeota archaeon]|nr:hypothetical protein [Candidatus Bathyarchaeota archaeon]
MPIARLFGKVTKLSRYGPSSGERLTRALRTAELCQKAGIQSHLIDSEWKWYYLMLHEAETLLTNSKILTIFTFTARHSNALRILRQTLSAAADLDSVGLNIVAGNKAYLDLNEIRKSPSKALLKAIKFVKKNYPEIKVFVGAEGLIKTSAQLSVEYGLVPMLILDKELRRNLEIVKEFDKNMEIALYAPYLISRNYPRLLHDILFRLAGYILRRRWVQVELKALGYEPSLAMFRAVVQEKKPLSPKLLSSKLGAFLLRAVSDLTIYGDQKNVKEKIRKILKLGIDHFFGLPIKENEYQILAFGECVNDLNAS